MHYTAVLYLIIDSSVLLKHPWCHIMVYLPTTCAGSIVLQATLIHVIHWDVILEVMCSIQDIRQNLRRHVTSYSKVLNWLGKLMLKFRL